MACFYCHKTVKQKELAALPDGREGHKKCVLRYLLKTRGGTFTTSDNVSLKID